ncbi:MAG: transcriptional regulator [Candidatus Gottesmanbacteria bacterium GW2011_GWA2_44_17]|uniref:Probable transcriptional regulatory protein UW52_C0003G0007 n=3 Tax=Candidatus Gottesmaniibacteriota TaxID=1752720 RepID=A0A0G1LNI1_9BACT|nr:MAG: transcriptional regulator [Microgenomates group bacterium GW2011_GWC1_43_11]KKT34594.1 MAG: transcriptional regulator [Candidatus Gottesmanbacteria bacterium GW2011_GWB1_44_11c]KKT47716.1 MAG: transcriptional regulator [Candidatus Gottesmanbacteria bacterium GW2011_GWA2_44_17]KKT61444.1 MAG: transcriptional regulator [Candidatus Gottesmanbacteria bacterium GW2011_GWA1_44_24b]HCM82713.1 YebC/PmpR family DNA-binding transcriptional regulator [Patescibacteria group bacterium]
MSGHSKWSKVKHQKATTDVLKGAAFTKATRAITIAVKEGGGVTDPNTNFHLRLAVEKARAVNMPKENIQRAMEKAKGTDAQELHQVAYEAYGPFGIAFYIEAATDNMNRTVSFIKQTLEHQGGSMAGPGAVTYLFDCRGVILVPKETCSYDTIFGYVLEFGAEDVQEQEDVFEVYTAPESLYRIKTKLEEKNVTIDSSSVVMQAKAGIIVPSEKQEIIDTLVERLEQSEDIQRVFTNT